VPALKVILLGHPHVLQRDQAVLDHLQRESCSGIFSTLKPGVVLFSTMKPFTWLSATSRAQDDRQGRTRAQLPIHFFWPLRTQEPPLALRCRP